jgi:hypothetical protein
MATAPGLDLSRNWRLCYEKIGMSLRQYRFAYSLNGEKE